MAENAYTKLPRNTQIAIGAVIAVLSGVGFYFGWYEAATIERDALVISLTDLEKQIAELNVVKANLPALEDQVKQLSLRLDQLRLILPPAKETSELMKRLQALASQSNLKIKSLTPGQTAQKEFYVEWPIEIQIDGTYSNLATFFFRVGRMQRIVNIGNLRAAASPRQSFTQTLSAQYTATTYVYTEPAAKPVAKK